MKAVDLLFLNVSRERAKDWMACFEGQGIVRDVHFISKKSQVEEWDESITIDEGHCGFYDLKLFLNNCRHDQVGEGCMVELTRQPPFFSLAENFSLKQGEEGHRDGYRESGITYRNIGELYSKRYYPQTALKNAETLFQQRPALLLDRDGIINVDKGYVYKLEDIEFCPGIVELVEAVKKKGWWVCVLSNQSGVGRGLYSREQVQSLHKILNETVSVDRWFFCPYHPEGVGEYKGFSHFRKPGPGMVLEAEQALPIDRLRSLMVGDKESDRIQLQGLRSWLVQGNYPLDSNKGDIFSDLNQIREKL